MSTYYKQFIDKILYKSCTSIYYYTKELNNFQIMIIYYSLVVLNTTIKLFINLKLELGEKKIQIY